MHEAGIARAILRTLRAHEAADRQARILVRGGRTPPRDFDSALRLHLQIEDPHLNLSLLEIVHLPLTLTCANCGARYDGDDQTHPCPRCGGGAWPDYVAEKVEIELLAESRGDVVCESPPHTTSPKALRAL